MRLDEVLAGVVAPVLAAMLPGEDVEEISLYREEDDGARVVLRVVVEGETFRFFVRVPGQAPESAAELRHRLAEDLQDFIAESTFGWGELRPNAP